MAQKQIRILHTLGSLDPGGVETWLLNVLKYIDRGHFQFDFCTFGPRAGLNAKEVERLGGKILRCPKDPNFLSFRRRFRKILREGNYDIVHSHVHLFSGALLRWAKAEGVPVRIAHSHTSGDDRPNTLQRRYYRKVMKSWVDRYATHGLAASRLAAAQLFGPEWESDARFRVLYYGIDLTPFQEPVSREEVRAELGIPIEAPVVGHVGRFVPAKNHRWLLEIAEAILKRRPDVHFLLVGDGPLRREIEGKARFEGIVDKMHFVGSRTDVPRLMRGGMNVFVFPSLWEGLPIALIEAQAAGLHCVLSDTITNEVKVLTELLIRLPLSTPCDEWAEATLGALTGKINGNGLAVEQLVRTDFDIRRSASDLSDLYSRPEE